MLKQIRALMESRIHSLEPSAFGNHSSYAWAKKVENSFALIRKEVEGILGRLDQITNFDSVLPGQRALYQGELWKSFFLVASGKGIKEHQKKCPETSRALKHIPGLINAFFSVLKPGTHIPPHRGPYAGIMRYHLGLIIPNGDVGIKVDGTTYRWKEGEGVFFDDSFEHEAWNKADSLRVILFVDFVRPLPQPLSFCNYLMLSALKLSKTVRKAKSYVLNHQLEETAEKQ